jgi:flagellar hook-length control protein FliK
MTTTPDPDQQSPTVNLRDKQSINSSASSGPDPSVVKMPESQIQSTFGEEPLSKILQEAQLVKEGVVKVESGSTEEAVSKVIKTDAGTNENGLSNSAGHNMEKAAESAAIQKNTEASQGHLRNQTMDQIVRKAAIHLRNGQHEARIELKPEFMGHIRMQVISENHLVTVKILAQHGFVKDMIESNVHQLKADLQQQGLEVDKLEVSVSRDSEDSGNFKDKFAQSKARQSHAGHQNEDQPAREKQRETAEPVRNAEDGTTVDYFA